jgi:hypothetical protein
MRLVRAIAAVVAIAVTSTLSFGFAGAQEAMPKPQPYKPVAVQPPQPVKDPSFVAFRQQIAEIAKRKDRAALAKQVAADFSWMTDEGKDVTLKGKPGIDNLARALYLDNAESEGWDILAAFAAEPTADPSPQRQGMICAPGEPKVDIDAITALTKATSTAPVFWYYPNKDGVEVRDGMMPSSKVTGKLGLYLVWVYPDESPAAAVYADSVRIVLPSGQFGYVAADALVALPGDLLCYVKDGDAWRIASFIGGLPPRN